MEEAEIELDYIEEEPTQESTPRRIEGSTQIKGRGKPCILCPGKFTHVRRHVLYTHLPWYTFPNAACWECKVQFGQIRFRDIHCIEKHPNADEFNCKFNTEKHGELWTKLMNGFLTSIMDALGLHKVEEIINYVNNNKLFQDSCQQSVFLPEELPNLTVFNGVNHLSAAVVSKPYPASSLLSLTHWRILALLRKISKFEDITTEKLITLYSPPNTTYFIDSHFHFEKTLKKIGSSDFFQFTTETNYNDKIQYGIANFCFPNSYPSSRQRGMLRNIEGMMMSFGIHPRFIQGEKQRNIDIWIEDLKHCLKSKRVVAVGECGLDITDKPTPREYRKQVSVFQSQIELARTSDLPLIIHCRGNPDTSKECLKLISNTLQENHPVHRHCFNGTIEEYNEWKKDLPQCKFGISPMILNQTQYPQLRETISEMDLNDLLLESDSPYLKDENQNIALPTIIREIARKIAIIHGKTTDEIAAITSSNAKQLYRLEP